MCADVDELEAAKFYLQPSGEGVEEFCGFSPVLLAAGFKHCPGGILGCHGRVFIVVREYWYLPGPTYAGGQLKLENAGVHRLVVIDLIQLEDELIAGRGVEMKGSKVRQNSHRRPMCGLGKTPPRWAAVVLVIPSEGVYDGRMPEAAPITLALEAIGRNEQGASEKLLPLVYVELRRLAGAKMSREAGGQTLQPTALVHEAWLRLVADQDRTWQNRAHFFGAAAEAMRRILIERARHRSRLKHGGGQTRLNIEDLELADTTPDDKVLLVNDALAHLKKEDSELERIVVLKFFGGLSNDEIAETLGVSTRTVDRQWAFARAWLFRYISENED